MADNDDFEIINDTASSEDAAFELIDAQDNDETFDRELSSPILSETKTDPPSPIVEPLISTSPDVKSSPPKKESTFLFNTTIPSLPSFLSVRKPEPTTTTSSLQNVPTKFVLAPVPPIPPPPAPRRYGDAATIPHNLCDTFNVNDAINKSRRQQQIALQLSRQNQQLKDVQTVIEQRRTSLTKKSD